MNRFLHALAVVCVALVATAAHAQINLRQSTASQELPLGRFVDSTDGNTEKTALTIANTDIKLWKNGATTWASKNSGGATHDANGLYYCVLDATDTNTLGPMTVEVHVAGALANKVTCNVLSASVYDAMYGTTALTTRPAKQTVPSFNDLIVVAQAGSANGSSVSVTFNDTGCDALFMQIADVTATTQTIVDPTGSTWQLVDDDSQGGFIRSRFYKCVKPITSATHTVTVTSIAPSVFIIGTKGLRLTDHTDQASQGISSSTSAAPGSITPSENNCIVVACVASAAAGTITAPGGYTTTGTPIGTNSVGAGNVGGGMAYVRQTTATATNPTWTVPNGGWIARVLSFKPALQTPGVALDSLADRQVFNREPFLAGETPHKRISFTGTYVDEAPTTIEVQEQRLVDTDGDGSYSDETATAYGPFRPVEGLAVSGGVWSGSLVFDEGEHWKSFKPRSRDANGQVLATGIATPGKTGVGICELMAGQSNSVRMNNGATTGGDELTSQYDGDWSTVVGDGSIAMANSLRNGAKVPVGLIKVGVAGSALLSNTGSGYWLDTSGGSPLTAARATLAAAGGDCEYVLWQQGEADCDIVGVSKSSYKTGLDTLRGYFLRDTRRTTSQQTWVIGSLARLNDSGATDDRVTAVRQALIEAPAEYTGMINGRAAIDRTLADNFHYNDADYAVLGRGNAQAILNHLGLATMPAKGPQIFAAWRLAGSNDVYLPVVGLRGYSLSENDGTTDGGSLTGFEVSTDSFATTLTISSTAFVGNAIRLRLSTTPADNATLAVRYMNGKVPSAGIGPIGNIARTSFKPTGDSVGLPLLPHESMNVELRTAYARGDLLTQAKLPLKNQINVGYTLKDIDGRLLTARATTGVSVLADDADGVLYGTHITLPADFESGYIVWDNGETSVQDLMGDPASLLTRDNNGQTVAEQLQAGAEAAELATPDTRDLQKVQFMWKLSRRSESTLVSTNTLNIAPNERIRAGFDCATDLVLPGGTVLGSMTDPTTTSDDLTVTKLGIDPSISKVEVVAASDATPGDTTYYVRTTVINEHGAGPITLIGKVKIVADPAQ